MLYHGGIQLRELGWYVIELILLAASQQTNNAIIILTHLACSITPFYLPNMYEKPIQKSSLYMEYLKIDYFGCCSFQL